MAHSSFFRQLHALCLRDLRQAFVNPVIFLYSFVPISLGVLLPLVVGTDVWELNAMAAGVVVSGVLACPTTTPTSFAFLEEWEHGTIRSLANSGVSPRALAAARMLTSTALTAALTGVGFAVVGFFLPGVGPGHAPLVALASAPAAFIGSALSLGCSFAIRKQEHVYTCCGATLVAFIVGMLQTMMLFPVFELMPFGSIIALLMQAAFGIDPLVGWPAVVAGCVGWVAASSAVLAFGLLRLEAALRSPR